MQQEGQPRFIHAHSGVVKGVAFSPKDRYVFCSGGTDGKVIIYSALQGQDTLSTKITSPNAMKNINAVKFNADGSRILLTTAKRLSVIDAERGELVCAYDNCAYSSRERAPLATYHANPFIAICSCTNGKGLITFDLRQPSPAGFALNIHSTTIKDVIYLENFWPWSVTHRGTKASVSWDGVCKVWSLDDRLVETFDVNHRASTLAGTSTRFRYRDDVIPLCKDLLMIGGEFMTQYEPPEGLGIPYIMRHPFRFSISKLKYSTNGHLLYATTSDGHVIKFRRMGRNHELISTIYSHDDEILDMDISPNDEYIVTASRDGNVGLLCLGAPSFGCSGYMDMA